MTSLIEKLNDLILSGAKRARKSKARPVTMHYAAAPVDMTVFEQPPKRKIEENTAIICNGLDQLHRSRDVWQQYALDLEAQLTTAIYEGGKWEEATLVARERVDELTSELEVARYERQRADEDHAEIIASLEDDVATLCNEIMRLHSVSVVDLYDGFVAGVAAAGRL